MRHGPGGVEVKTVHEVCLPPDPFVRQRLRRDGVAVKELLFAYIGASKGLRWAESRQPGSHEGAWPRQLFEPRADEMRGGAGPGKGRRFDLVVGPEREHRTAERIIARPDREIVGAEAMLSYDPGANELEGEPVISTDTELGALWAEQRRGDLVAARRIIIANNDRMDAVEAAPLFCLSAAYLLPFTKLDECELEGSLDWLDRLSACTPTLPDADIIKAALLGTRRWNADTARWPSRLVRHEAAARIALRSLDKGLPSHRFGLAVLETMFSGLSDLGELQAAKSGLLQRAAALVTYAGYFGDPRLMCTSLVFI
jgi:hypothetical protein